MSDESIVVQTSFLGDTVLTTPLISELSARGPVDVLVTPAAAALLANNPCIRTLFVYDKRDADAGIGGAWRTARRLRTHYRRAGGGGEGRGETHTRTAYLAQASVRSAVVALLAGIGERVGFANAPPPARALYTVRVPHRSGMHHAERLWRLALAAGAGAAEAEAWQGEARAPRPTAGAASAGSTPGSAAPTPRMPPPRLYPGQAERNAVDILLGSAVDERPLVALAPGSVWATKRWPHYAELARRLAPRCRLALVGSGADSDAARHIVDAAGGGTAGVVDATGKLSLLGSAELIGRAALLVTNDSSPQHLASAMDTPTITLFGPTAPEFGFGPLAPGSLTLGHPHLACRPCHHHGPPECPLGHWRCMMELDVEVVETAVWEVLEEAGIRGQGSGTADQRPPDGT